MELVKDGAGSVDEKPTPSSPVDGPANNRQTPLTEVSVDLATGMSIQMDRCVGDVPVLEVLTGRTRLAISVDVGDVREVDDREVALAEVFAAAACELRDELRLIVTNRLRPVGRNGLVPVR